MMQMKNKLSIIIPTFNSEKYIPALLKNITGQTLHDYELVIIDNVSVDNTITLIKEFTHHIDINIISEKDNGIYEAMNKGIKNATGEWLYFMGTDDIFDNENVLQSVYPFLTSENDIVYGDSIWMPKNIKEEGEWTYPVFINRNINHQRIFYKRELFRQYTGLNTKYKIASDHEMNIRLFCNDSIRKKYIPIAIARFHSGGFSSNKTDEAFWADWDKIILKNFKSHLPKKIIYGSLGAYIRYLVDKKKYTKAIALLCKHFYHTRSLGFVKLMLDYFGSPKTNYAG